MSPLLYGFLIFPFSRLPFRILYLLSDGLFVLVFYVAKYRRRVVEGNITRSFPELSPDARKEIVREFYRHFCDIVVESLKSFSISDEEIRKRFRFENPELLTPYFESGRSLILAGGHYNSWEWLAVGLGQQMRHRAVAIYKPLSSSYFEKKMRATRGKFGLELLPMKNVPDFFKALPQSKVPVAMIFGCDQSPGDGRKAHWMTFLNQDTAVAYGAEKYAREYDLPVFFGVVHKTSRGHYSFRIEPLTDHPRESGKGEIIEGVTRRLEVEIRKDPRYWLWTHRRWKHTRP